MKALFQKPFMFFVMLLIGAALAAFMIKSKPTIEHSTTGMPAKAVDVITVRPIEISPHVTAYGTVEPAIALKTKAQVSGKISYLHPGLQSGGSILQGTLVAKIDPEDSQISLSQSEADLRANLSSLAQLNEEEKTTRRSLQYARQNLRVGEKELARIRDIWDKQLISRSTLDAEEQKVLQLRQSTTDLQGQLNTYASRKDSTKAQIERATQQVKGQTTTLGRTEIYMPFDARVGEVLIEEGEYVTVGTYLFESLAINRIEINAQLPVQKMRTLISSGMPQGEADTLGFDLSQIMEQLNFSAHVSLVGASSEAHWEAKLLRFSESVDPVRRTLGVVVAVDNPYQKVIPGKRPPLIKGMYTAVDLYAPAYQAIVIPRSALHEGRVYLSNTQQQLEIRSVNVLFNQDNLIIIESGLEAGEQIIINDLIPVIEGMPLQPILDIQRESALRAAAKNPAQLTSTIIDKAGNTSGAAQ
ncbi:efflux RND transporter periplasmic adaptor subunit [Neptunomonas japonica]|uniref:efflux RND transporter periplasmic adaptor subunit n=1 Tax=Neptunomonas japonica TaxID=417574 RepID=UPI0004068720|nr:HlyD family secretion protein [Neptunomonas japonica]